MSSLVSAAMRMALRKALTNRTFAGENVYDSAATTFDEFVKDNPQPFITISTDEDRATVRGHDLLSGEREIDLIIEIAVASEVTVDGIVLPHTDETLELVINYMVRQVLRVLQVDEGDDWGDVFRSIAGLPKSIESKRGAHSSDSIRYAARQIIIIFEPIDEPPFDAELMPVWTQFLDLLKADVDWARIADGFEAAIVGTLLPDWRLAQAQLGLHRGALAAIGLGPLLAGEEPAPFFTGISDGDHLSGVAHGFIANDIEVGVVIGTPTAGAT